MHQSLNAGLPGPLAALVIVNSIVCGQTTTAPDKEPAPPAASQPRRPIADARRAAAELRVPDQVQLVRDVVYAEVPSSPEGADGTPIELMMDVAFLKDSDVEKLPAIIYIHGGGWSSGSREAGLRPSIGLAMGGYFAATIDYRLSGVARFPAAVHDCKAAVRFLRANAEKLGINPDRIGVWGHSAGGHLAALLGATSNSEDLDGDVGKAPRETSSAVQCVVDFSGPIDLTLGDGARENGPITAWLGGPVRTHRQQARQASPTTYIDAADPPTMIIHGTDDRIVNIRHSALFEKALKDAGVPVEFIQVEGAGHMFVDVDAYRAAAAWFDKYLGGKAEGAIRELLQGVPNQRPAPRRAPPTPPPASDRENTPMPADKPPAPMDDHPAPE